MKLANPLHHSVRHSALTAACLLALSGPIHAQTYNWTGGTFTPGVTAPATLGAAEVLNINSGGTKYFDSVSGVFTNGGTVNWNSDPLYLQGSAQIVNNNLWLAWSDQTLAYNGGSPSFVNNGTFRKTAGTGDTTIASGIGFVNNGVLDAQSGSINFVGGSSFNAGTQFIGAGSNRVSSGFNSFNGAFTSTNLLLAGGSHVGSAAEIHGVVQLTGGSLLGSWSVAAGQQLDIGGGGFKYLDGGNITNSGTVNWNADALYLQNGVQVLNTGLWNATSDQVLAYNGGNGGSFSNTGTLRKSGGSGSTTVQGGLGFVNTGVLDVQTGSLNFVGGSSFNAGTVFTGAGRNLVTGGNNSFSGALNSGNLTLQGGDHVGSAAALNGLVRFEGGRLYGTWTVNAGQTLAAHDGGFKYLNGTLTNQGTVAWNTGNALYLENGGTLVNQGLFVANTSTLLANNGGAQPLFDNQASGTLRAAAGTTLTVSNVLVNNGGLLEAEAGATLRYNGGAVFNAGSRFGGAGLNLVAGSSSFNGEQISGNLELQGGSHSGTAAAISGLVVFSGGQLQGSWQVNAGSVLSGVDGGFKYLVGTDTVLTNQGTVAWNTGNAFYFQSGASFVNQGLFVASVNSSVLNNGGAAQLFDNTASGTVRALAGTTLTLGNMLVNNGGTLDAQAGGTLRYTGGAVFNTGTQFTGAGSNVAAGDNRFSGSFGASNLVLESGTHSGDGAVAHGSTRFTGGTLAGTWQVAAGQTLSAGDGGFKYLSGSDTVLDNRGSLRWATGNALYLQNGATLNNSGSIDLQADTAFLYNGGAAATFINTGLIVKSAGEGTATIGNNVGFDNRGTVDVQSGNLALPGNFVNHGMLKGTGSYTVSGTFLNAGTVAPGASPGTLALQGNYAQAGEGSFAVELASLGSHDLFTVSGTATLDGTLALICYADCSLAVGDVLTILDSAGDLSGSFASITLSGFATGAFSVVYDVAADRVQLLVTEAVTAAVPEPRTYALWLAGLGALGWLRRRRLQG